MMELLLTLVLSLLAGKSHAVVTDPLQYVDQLIGTQAGGRRPTYDSDSLPDY